MAVQTLDPQQVIFVARVRRALTDLVRAILQFDTLIADYDGQQDAGTPGVPIVIDGDTLADQPNGNEQSTTFRPEVPQLTGTLLQAIRDNIGDMRGEISASEYNILVSLVPDLDFVIRGLD